MKTKVSWLDWIFFDLGSTLTDESRFEEYMLGQVYEALRNYCTNVDREAFDKTLRIVVEERRYGSGGYRNLVREIALCFLKAENQLQRIIEGYDNNVGKKYWKMQVLYNESIGVLNGLGNNYGLGLIANQPTEARRHLENLGLANYLKVIVLSDEVGFGKPDPRIFLHALKIAECERERAMMVGDRLDNDITPAKSVGMKTVRVKRGIMAYQKPLTEMEIADQEIPTLKSLLALLRREFDD